MTTKEFSDQFDILLNSYYQQGQFGDIGKQNIILDEYEKSIFLTQAQEEIIKSYYEGQYSQYQFDSTEQIKRAMSSLIKESFLQGEYKNSDHISSNSYIYNLPMDHKVWYIIYESLQIDDGEVIPVIPVTYDEWHKIKRNPFRGPSNFRAIRLDYGKDTINDLEQVILVTNKIIDTQNSNYTISYISKPSPIILEDLTNSNLSINGVSTKSECSLHPSIHSLILNRAVKLAIDAHK